MAPSVATIILLNYNTRQLTLESLSRLVKDTHQAGWEIIVVDNASNDATSQAVADNFPRVMLIEASENRGYAAGNNRGLEIATGRAVILLNSDVVVHLNQLQALTDFLDEHPDVGAVSAGLRTMTGEAQAFAYGGDPSPLYLLRRGLGHLLKLPPLHDWALAKPLSVDWVSGACLCVRRSVVEQINGMDENFFLYFEDVDWCRRMRLAGWRVVYNPLVHVVHLGGQSQPQRRVANRHYSESLRYFYRKHYGIFWGTVLDLSLALYTTLRQWTGAE